MRMTATRARTWAGHGDLVSSLVLIVPLFLAYEIGVLFAGHVNGADVVTRAVYDALGRSTYLIVHAAIALGFVVWLRRGERWRVLRLEVVAPVLLEAAIYALTLGAVGTLVVERVLGLGLTAGSVVDALGAGVHEELVFRLLVMGGLVFLLQLRAFGIHPRLAVAVALVVSAVAFSAAHHAGPHGEPFTQHAFAFRCVAGIAFGLVFWFRSLAHAVYAHALYDIVVYARG
jgi:hypothetical protein